MKIKHSSLLSAWLSILIICGWWLSQHTHLRTDLSLFLPEGNSAQQQFLLSELHQGYATRLLLLAIGGGDARQRASLSQSLLGALRKGNDFRRVENGTPGDLEVDPRLFEYRYLLSPEIPGNPTFTAGRLTDDFKARLRELGSPIPTPFKALLPRDPTGAYQAMLNRWQMQREVTRSEGVWSSRQGDLAILLAETGESGLAIDRQQSMLERINKTFEQLDTSGEHKLIISGPAAFSVQSKHIIEHESRLLSLIASLAIALMLFLAYRHIPYLLYAALPLLTAVMTSILVTGWIFKELHGITLAFGITLLGVSLDYPVHLFSHIERRDSPVKAMKRIWQTLRLGVFTTCLGYLVLVTTAFEGLKQLGIFTLIGLLTAAFSSRYLLPHLYPKTFEPPQLRGTRLVSVLAHRDRRLPFTLISITLLLVAWSAFSPQRLWNDDITVLSPLPPSLIAQDRSLRQQLEADETNQMILLRGREIEQLLQQCESLRPIINNAVDERLLNGATMLCDYLPSQQTQRIIQSHLPETEHLNEQVQLSLKNLPFHQHAFTPFIEDIASSRLLVPMTYDMTAGTQLRDLLTPYIRKTADGWAGLVPLQHVVDGDALSQRLLHLEPDVKFVNLSRETSELIGNFRQITLQYVLFGVCLMLVVLWMGLKSLRRAISILLPIALAIVLTASLLKLTGEAMNLFHLISLMLVLGISLDYSLFFSRKPLDLNERKGTLHALGVCALSTVTVFSILATSSIPVLHSIGMTVSIGVTSSFLLTYALSKSPAPESSRLQQ
ncbi:MAG: MMPL family transporter [Candidatus Thiodiazotropha sp. (ex Monitilora ramsayi)]|nr:MMPL family transporter [Candidatus Thiodiazotropha sp. (ex Monitilora ramsayi)]